MPYIKVNMPNDEPEQRKFPLPSEGKFHHFRVVDLIDCDDPMIDVVKLEVSEGKEMGRSLLHRVSSDVDWKGFFLTRLFLKAIKEPYKGSNVTINPENWIGGECYATVIHNMGNNGKLYANIDEFIFDGHDIAESNDPNLPTEEKQVSGWDDDKE